MRSDRAARVRRGSTVAAAAVLTLGVAGGTLAEAATPSSGTVTPTSPTKTYTAGPFTVPNTTGAAGPVQCGSQAMPCDDYKLTVTTPAGYGDGHSLNISVSWPNSAADFDVYLLDAKGQELASSASSADPEVITVPPTSGTYTVRVVPYAPLGQSITGNIALQSNPAQPPPANVPGAGFKNFPAPDALTDSHNAGEPSIGYDWKTNKAMYQSYLSTYRVGFTDTSSGTTAQYVDRSASAAKGCPGGSTTSLDPILFTDRYTNRTFESQLLDAQASGSQTCLTSDDGDNWTQSQGGGVGSGVDHQTLGGGPFSKNSVLKPLTNYPDAVYYCSQDIAEASCSVSADGGVTFGPAVPMYTIQQCGGLHGHVKVAPDGTAYVPNKNCGGHPAVVVSTDSGAHWAVRPVPNGTPGDSDPSVAIGANGTVYLGWNGSNNHAYAAVSHDRGETWSNVQDVGAQLGIQNSVFPAAVAGDDNRAAIAFIGTKTGGNYQDQTNFHGVWQLYVAATYNGGKNWKTANATGTDPVQRGSICTGGTTCGNDRNLLDFIDATIDPQGRVLVGYADGCTAACVTTTNPVDGQTKGYHDALATIARQSSGYRMYAKADPLPDLTVSGIQASRDTNGVEHVSAVVANKGKATASNAVVKFVSGCACSGATIGTSAPVTLAPGASKRVTVTWTNAPKGTSTVTAIADPANAIREAREDNNKCVAQVTVS